MPELPDLEVFSHNLQKILHGKTVSDTYLKSGANTKTSAAAFLKALRGRQLKKVYREGKELRLAFDEEQLLGIHLMLHGKLVFTDGAAEEKHTIFSLSFEDGSRLSLTDYQGIANPTLNPPPGEAPDALSDELTQVYLAQTLGKSRAAVKNLLLDQHVVRGIGNAYADEILWEAGISPFSVAKAIPEAQVKALLKAIRHVLNEAIRQIRKHKPDIISGEVRDFLKIHQHHTKESPGGAPIQQQTKGGRKTYFTAEQTLYE